MQKTVGDITINLVKGDITEQRVDAIVNAANSGLLGGGGVDGAIHKKGGPSIVEACKQVRDTQGKLPPGQAVATTAGNLPARRVIHAVGPIWQGGTHSEFIELEGAYRSSLQIALDEGLRTIAFPSISTGAYRFPIDRAARLAMNTVCVWAKENAGKLDEIRFVLFTNDDLKVYEDALEEIVATQLG